MMALGIRMDIFVGSDGVCGVHATCLSCFANAFSSSSWVVSLIL